MATDITKFDGLSRLGTTVYASQAYTSTPNSKEFEIGPGWNGVSVVIDTTAVSSASTVFKLEGVDRLSGKTYGGVTSAAVVGTGTVTLTIGIGVTVVASQIVSQTTPPVVRVTATCSGTSHTFSAALLLS